MEPEAGDYWMVKINGEDWPLVICDEDMVQEFFKEVRPANGCQADGTWCKDLRGGNDSFGLKVFPVLYLGTMRRTWAPRYTLEAIESQMAIPIRDSTNNAELAAAWDQVDKYYGKELKFWKDVLNALQQQKEPVQTSSAGDGKKSEKRKRKGALTNLPSCTYDEADDDEEALFLPKAPKIKQEVTSSISAEETNSLYEESKTAKFLRAMNIPKKNKLDASGNFSARPATPSGIHSRPSTPLRGSPLKKSSSSSIEQNAADPNKVMIYVGNPHIIYRVKRSVLAASQLLSSLLAQHPTDGWYIMSPLLSSIDRTDFLPIAEYVHRGDYNPRLLNEGTDHLRLEGFRTLEEEGHEVVRCGMIYSRAQALEFFGLQDLAFRKLKLLSPFSTSAILSVIEAVFEGGKADIRQFLVQYVADHYWEIVLKETASIAKLMQGNEDLAKGVFGRLSGVSAPDESARSEAKVGANIEPGAKEEEMLRDGVAKMEKDMAPMVSEQSGQQNTQERCVTRAREQSEHFEEY